LPLRRGILQVQPPVSRLIPGESGNASAIVFDWHEKFNPVAPIWVKL
jgi:hypothetical protein